MESGSEPATKKSKMTPIQSLKEGESMMFVFTIFKLLFF